MCDEHPCDSRHMCRLDTKKCVPLSAPGKIKRTPVLRVKIEDNYFIGSEMAISHLISNRLSQVTELPCTLGPDGIETKGEMVSSFGPETMGIIDLESGEVLCELTESVLEALNDVRTVVSFLEGNEDETKEERVCSFPYWNTKYILERNAEALNPAFSGKYLIAIVPTQYIVEIDGETYYRFYAVPIGVARRDETLEYVPPTETFPVSIPPKGMLAEEKEEELMTIRREKLPPEVDEMVREFLGPILFSWRFDDKNISDVAVANDDSMKIAIGFYEGVAGDREKVEVWQYNEKIGEVKIDSYSKVLFNPIDSNVLAISSLGLSLWYLPTNILTPLSARRPHRVSASSNSVFDWNGILYTGYGKKLVGYDTTSGETFNTNIKDTIDYIATSPTGEIALRTIYEILIYSSDLQTYEIINPHRNVREMAFSPDGRYLATTGGPIVYVYDLETSTFVELPNPEGYDVYSSHYTSFNASGDRIVAKLRYQRRGNRHRSIVCVWNAKTYEISQVIRFRGDPLPHPTEPYWLFVSYLHLIELVEID